MRTIGAEEREIRRSLERLITRVRFVGEYFEAVSLRELLNVVKNTGAKVDAPA